jgi:hypothetical protein
MTCSGVAAECFCLEHEVYGDFEFGCVSDEEDIAWCVTLAEDGTAITRFEMSGGYRRVEDGEGACFPCMPATLEETEELLAGLPPNLRGLFAEELPAGDEPQ